MLWLTRWLQVRWGSLPIVSSGVAAKDFSRSSGLRRFGAQRGAARRFAYCDNMAVFEVLNRQAAKDPLICHQLRSMFYISARFDFDVVARHTPGVANVAADAISRNNIPLFRLQVPGATLFPTPVPSELATGISAVWKSRH